MTHDFQMPSESILAIDCGSTTTQVTLFAWWRGVRFIARGEAQAVSSRPGTT